MAVSSTTVRIVVMEGDGIGPEITAATLHVLAAADRAFGLALSFTPVAIGLAALRAEGKTLSERAVEAATSADGVILGPVSHNEYPPVAQGGSIRRANCASGSTCSPTSVRRAAAAVFRRAAGLLSILSSCARTPKDFTPTARCSSVRRVHADARPRALGAQGHPHGLDPHRGGGFCLALRRRKR